MASVYYELNEDETADAPVSLQELQRMLADGTISMDTRCWREGMEDWAPLRECKELLPKQETADREWSGLDASLPDIPMPTEEPQRRQSFAEEFITSLSPVGPATSPHTGYGSRNSAVSSGYTSPRYSNRIEARTSVLRSQGGVAVTSVENLLARMESRMQAVETAAEKNDKAARDASRFVPQVESVERRNRELETEVAELRRELGGLTQRVTNRVLESIDLDALERRIVLSVEEQEEKIQRMQTAVDAALRNAEVAGAASLARHRERYENEQRVLVKDIENSSRRQLELVEDQVSRVREHMGRLEEKFDGDVRPVVDRCDALERTFARAVEQLEADLRSTETKLRNSSEHGLAAAAERLQKTTDLVRESVDSLRKTASDERVVVRDLIDSSVKSSTDSMSERVSELDRQLREDAAALRELTEKRVSDVKESVDVYLKRANEDNSYIKQFTKDSIDTLKAAAKELERKAHQELLEESAKLRSVVDQNRLLLEPAVAVCREDLQQEILDAEERSAKELQLVVKRHQKDWEANRGALERVQTQIFLDAQEVAATLKTLGKDLDTGLGDMEARVDETMSACDMNVLLQETNFVALVESTAKRVDQFEQRFEQRIGVLENGSLQRLEDRLQEVHELAKGTTTHLKHTVDQKITAIERKQKADASAVSSLKTKVLIEGDEMRDTLRTLGQELYNSIDAMEDRVDEVCSAAEMNTVLDEFARRAHAEASAMELKAKEKEIEWAEEQRQSEREARLAAKKVEILAQRKRQQDAAWEEQQTMAKEALLAARAEEQAAADAEAMASSARDADETALRDARYEREEDERLRRVQDEKGAAEAAMLAARLQQDTDAAAETLARDLRTGAEGSSRPEADAAEEAPHAAANPERTEAAHGAAEQDGRLAWLVADAGPIAGTVWELVPDEDGDLYFNNNETGETTWDEPAEVAAARAAAGSTSGGADGQRDTEVDTDPRLEEAEPPAPTPSASTLQAKQASSGGSGPPPLKPKAEVAGATDEAQGDTPSTLSGPASTSQSKQTSGGGSAGPPPLKPKAAGASSSPGGPPPLKARTGGPPPLKKKGS